MANEPRPAQGLPHEFCESCIALKHGDKTLKNILPQLVVPRWCWGGHNDTMSIELYYVIMLCQQFLKAHCKTNTCDT